MKSKTAILSIWMVYFLTSIYMAPARAQSNHDDIVFRIGTFDRSSFGFAGRSDYGFNDEMPSQPINYVVGKSQAEKDWYATQPAAIETETGQVTGSGKTVPRTISFSLPGTPTKVYKLHVALLIEGSSVPALRVGINGKYGTFYLQPTLDYKNGDQADFYYPAYSHADVEFKFPGSYLKRGMNTITLQAVEKAGEVVPDAKFTYDAIELDRNASSFDVRASSAQIIPTIFYRKQQNQLNEIVNVILRYREQVKLGSSVDLSIAGKSYRQVLQHEQNFGERKLEFSIPEFPARTKAQLRWNVTGHAQRSVQIIDPRKKWTLLLVPHLHVDVGYSDYQAKIASIQSRMMDQGMDLTAQHPGFVFSMDGGWSLEQFMNTRTPAEQQRAITALQKQTLFVPANYANLLTGFPTAETLIRSLYPGANFSRVHGTPFNYATIVDVPSYSWSYASILASAGIRYFLSGSDNYRAPVLLQGRLNENSPFWWEGPDGQKVLLWYSRHYMQMELLFGLPPMVSAGHDTIPLLLQQFERPSYRANAAILFGTQVENMSLFPQQAELKKQWNSIYAYPHIEYSGFHDALKNIAQQFGDKTPTIRGDGGPYWEDGIASDSYYAAMERQNESRGLSAEKLATLTSLVNPRLSPDKLNLDRMWTNMVLMDEHTMDSDNSITQPTSMEATQQLGVKNSYAINARDLADFITRNSMATLADSISAAQNSLIVFNTLNWQRSGFVAIDLNQHQEIVDPSGQVVPYEVLRNGKNFNHVQFIAKDIPAVGFKIFQLRTAQAEPIPAETTQNTVLESRYYRVTLDPGTGAVLSIYDKQLQHELVNQQSSYRFGQYLYVSGGDQSPNTILRYSSVYPKPQLQIHPAHDGKLISVTRTPYGCVARMESTDTNTPKISSAIQLFDREKKIVFIENVNKKEVDSKEAVYFAFPFAMKQPQFQYEIQTGVVDPAKDMYPGAGHEWFSVQHWVSVQQNGISATVMPLDASLVTMGDINRGAWPSQFGERTGAIFSYVMNNYWDTNYRAGQGGNFRFRYVITSASSTDAAQLSHMGWAEMTPLEKDKVTYQDRTLNLPRPLKGKEGSFVDVNDSNILLDTWKPAEDGNGTILRFLDLGGPERTVTVQTPLLQLQQGWQTDAVERNRKPLSLAGTSSFNFTIHPHEIVTIRVVGKDVTQAPKR